MQLYRAVKPHLRDSFLGIYRARLLQRTGPSVLVTRVAATRQRLISSSTGPAQRAFRMSPWATLPLLGAPIMFFWLQKPPNLTWMFPHATDKDEEAMAADDETAAPVFIAYVETPYPLQPLTLLFRFVFLFIIYMPLLLTLPFWVLSERWTGQESGLRRPWIKALCWVMELSGPTFIKLGQWASSRVDLFPPEICDVLSVLQSSVTPHSERATIKVLEKEYGPEWRNLFEQFDFVPIGVGAIAQVYKAKLKDSGRCVAVKILHPGVSSKIHADLRIMGLVARLINAIPGANWLSLPDEVATFGRMMQSQLDLRNEAHHLDLFAKRFAHRNSDGITFPLVVEEFKRQSVLIEDFAVGIPINKFLSLGPSVFDETLARQGLRSFLKMLIIDNFVHADLHPGNILVTFTTPTPRSQEIFESLHTVQNHATWSQKLLQLKAEGSKPRLVLLDAGLVSSLSHRNLVNFLDLFVAITQFDGRLIARLMIERSSAPETVRDPTGFEDTMHVFLSRVKAQTTALQHIHVGEILGTVLNMVRQYHVKIEGDFVNVAVAIMLTEGMGKRLDDNVDVIQESVPILKSVKGRGDQVAELAGQVYRKAQVYSAAMSIKKRVVDLFSMVSSG